MTRERQHPHHPSRRSAAFLLVAVVAAGSLLAGCGSSKPSYCSAVSNLEKSIKAVPSTDVVANGTNALKSALEKVQSDAKAVISSAKSDFPNETSALSSSVSTLTNSAKQLPSSPTPQAIAQLAGQAGAVVSAAKNLQSATSSKCG